MPCPSIGPKSFWTVQIILVEYQSFLTGLICFFLVQIKVGNCLPLAYLSTNYENYPRKVSVEPDQNNFGPKQNNLYPSRTIWVVQSLQNNFGPIEGQGINH